MMQTLNQTKPRVLLIQPGLAHYRKSFFETLLASSKLNFKIITGEGRIQVKTWEARSVPGVLKLKNLGFHLLGHRFFWQKNLFSAILHEKPAVVILPGIDFHFPGTLLAALYLRWFSQIKIIWWGHANVGNQGVLGKKIRQLFFGLGDGIITYNRKGAALIKSIFPEMPVTAIFNAINREDYGFQFPRMQKAPESPLSILFSGRLLASKRPDLLLDALAILLKRNFHFDCVFIGDGPELEFLKEKTVQSDLKNFVQFPGQLYGEEASSLFAAADIFVLPGKVGLSIVHALSFGLPVLTTGKLEVHSPEHEIIQPGINGDFFEDFLPESLADRIMEWQEKLKGDENKIREQCRQSVLEAEYLPDHMAEKMLNFTKQILAT